MLTLTLSKVVGALPLEKSNPAPRTRRTREVRSVNLDKGAGSRGRVRSECTRGDDAVVGDKGSGRNDGDREDGDEILRAKRSSTNVDERDISEGRAKNAGQVVTGAAAILSITARLDAFATRPNTVNPPFCVSSCDALLARLKNHWLVALFGSLPSFAIAMVPRVLETLNSFCTAASAGIWYRPVLWTP